MLVKTEAIVVHTLKYGESRMIVNLFTRKLGLLSCIISIPRTNKGKVKKQLFQPLSLIDVECDVRTNVQLQKVRDARMLSPYRTIPLLPQKMAIALFVSEFLYHALRSEQQADEQLYDYMKHGLMWLDAAVDGYANFHLTFLMHLSRFLGFYPNMEHYSSGVFFDLRAGTFCNEPPLHQDFLHPEEASQMRILMRMDYQTMHLFRINRIDRNRCLSIILTYYGLHLSGFPEMKSLAVLQELFV